MYFLAAGLIDRVLRLLRLFLEGDYLTSSDSVTIYCLGGFRCLRLYIAAGFGLFS